MHSNIHATALSLFCNKIDPQCMTNKKIKKTTKKHDERPLSLFGLQNKHLCIDRSKDNKEKEKSTYKILINKRQPMVGHKLTLS